MSYGYWVRASACDAEVSVQRHLACIDWRGIVTANALRAVREQISHLLDGNDIGCVIIRFDRCALAVTEDDSLADLCDFGCSVPVRASPPLAILVNAEQVEIADALVSQAASRWRLGAVFTEPSDAVAWAVECAFAWTSYPAAQRDALFRALASSSRSTRSRDFSPTRP